MKKTMIIITLLVSVLTCFAEEVSTNKNIEQDTIQLNYDLVPTTTNLSNTLEFGRKMLKMSKTPTRHSAMECFWLQKLKLSEREMPL